MNALIPVGIAVSAIVAGALSAGMIQTGGLQIHVGSIGFRLDRINPLSNLKNLFSLRAASRLGKSLLPAGLLAVFAVQRIARELTIPPFSTSRLNSLASDIYGLLVAAAWLLLGWALVDYVVEWRSRESRLMMSREEMKQEFKETEGSPQTRGRIRGLQRQMRRRKVKADVSKAAVILTNPTHYAVALGFDFVAMDAPKVLAKGRNLLAEEIKVEARWAGVPIIENPPLARSLYRSVEVGHAIPVDLYAAVAAILAYLYRQRVEAEMRERRARQQASQAKGASAESHAQARPVRLPAFDQWHRRASPQIQVNGPMETSDEHCRSESRTSCARRNPPPGAGLRVAHGSDQRDLRHADSAARRGTGFSPCAIDGGLDHCLSLLGTDSPSGRTLGLSHAAAAADAVSSCSEYRFQPPHPASWFGRDCRCRQGD